MHYESYHIQLNCLEVYRLLITCYRTMNEHAYLSNVERIWNVFETWLNLTCPGENKQRRALSSPPSFTGISCTDPCFDSNFVTSYLGIMRRRFRFSKVRCSMVTGILVEEVGGATWNENILAGLLLSVVWVFKMNMILQRLVTEPITLDRSWSEQPLPAPLHRSSSTCSLHAAISMLSFSGATRSTS